MRVLYKLTRIIRLSLNSLDTGHTMSQEPPLFRLARVSFPKTLLRINSSPSTNPFLPYRQFPIGAIVYDVDANERIQVVVCTRLWSYNHFRTGPALECRFALMFTPVSILTSHHFLWLLDVEYTPLIGKEMFGQFLLTLGDYQFATCCGCAIYNRDVLLDPGCREGVFSVKPSLAL